MPRGSHPDLEVRLFGASGVEEDQTDTEGTTENVDARNVFLGGVVRYHDVGAMREELVCARLAERDDQAGLLDLEFGLGDLGWRFENVALLRLADAEHVRGAPLVFEAITASGTALVHSSSSPVIQSANGS